MRTRRWSLAVLLFPLALGGCASGTRATIPSDELVGLPAGEQAPIAEGQRRLHEAETNVTIAQENQRAAKQFQAVASGQLAAANTTLKADPRTRRDHRVAELKAGYAAQLIAMREAELDLRLAEVEAARADLELAKFHALERADRVPTVGARDFQRDRDDALKALARSREQLARQQGEVERLRVAWDSQRRDVAARDVPPQLPAPTGANEGPAAGSSTQEDKFAR